MLKKWMSELGQIKEAEGKRQQRRQVFFCHLAETQGTL
jgi:hypothetical protein